jgi:galactokinase
MDQLVSLAAVEGMALRIDCDTLELEHVPFPEDAEIVVIHSGQHRQLSHSAYAERRAECEAAELVIGRLRDASPIDAEAIDDPLLRRRARHVTTENQRVDALASALAHGQLGYAGELLVASHVSLRDDFEVSTPALDDLVTALRATPGVYGARVTGAGFGGCVIALCRPDAPIALPTVWRGRPAAGAALAAQ